MLFFIKGQLRARAGVVVVLIRKAP
jgi:hypothetical protein